MTKDDDAVDADMLLRLAFEHADRPRSDGSSMLSELAEDMHSFQWLVVLSAPKLFFGMNRTPTREHLLRMADMYLASVRRDRQRPKPQFEPVPYEQREPLTRQLRTLLETWSPPGLPEEISDVARAVLFASGVKEPNDTWDNAYGSNIRIEDHLIWPEDVAAWTDITETRRKSGGKGHA